MSIVRLRRLQADSQQLMEYVRSHPRLQMIEADGDPPERYQIEFKVRSLRQVGDELTKVKSHLVEILLPRNYPRVPPTCRMLTPVFHPNIAPHAICIGDHWSAGEPLISIVSRIGEMLAYQSYNVKSPLNGEAARWVDEHQDELPLDSVSMMYETPTAVSADALPPPRARQNSDTLPLDSDPFESEPEPTSTSALAPAAEPLVIFAEAPPPSEIRFHCPGCGVRMKAAARKAGSRFLCPRCQAEVIVPDA